MLSAVMQYLEEKHYCTHFSCDLALCHATPVHVGDGLGWGSEYLFICLNDACPLFIRGWDYIESQYGHVGSYRYMELPNSKESYTMMVVGKEAFTGSVVDIEDLKRQNSRYQQQQKNLAALDQCQESKQLEPVLTVILDDALSLKDRKRALKILETLNDPAGIEPLRNHVFKDPHLAQEVNLIIDGILAKNFLKECPYCTELIKVRATVCKHCQRELAT